MGRISQQLCPLSYAQEYQRWQPRLGEGASRHKSRRGVPCTFGYRGMVSPWMNRIRAPTRALLLSLVPFSLASLNNHQPK